MPSNDAILSRTPREFKEQLRWFAREVMPAFSGAEVQIRAAE